MKDEKMSDNSREPNRNGTEGKQSLTVIQGAAKKRGKWQERIDAELAAYERELERKKELNSKTGFAEVFTPEDIDFMMIENESFKGKNVDFSKVEKYNRLAQSAQWLDANHMDIIGTRCPPLPKGRAGSITVDVKSLSIFDDISLRRTLAGMLLTCDNFTISGLDEGKIQLGFMVKNIRTK